MKLQVTNDQAIAFPAAANAAAAGMRLEPFMPRRFGDVVLCLGPSDVQWPSDRDLLERLGKAAQAVMPRASRTGHRKTGGLPAFALSMLGVVFAVGLFAGYSARPAQARSPQEPLSDRVQQVVARLSEGDVKVRGEGERVIVEGLLPTNEDVSALRTALADMPAELIDHRYASIAQISQSIVEAMRLPEAKATYLGAGVFRLEAAAVHPEQVQREAERVAADLAPLVERIEVAVKTLPAPERVPVAAALSSDGMRYVQTRDGAKYLELSPGSAREHVAFAAQREARRSDFSSLE